MTYDVVIIGAGVVGLSTARYLSRYDLKVLVVEKEEDICSGTSKANSAIVHAGHDAMPGTLKARFNVLDSKMMEGLSKELDFAYIRNGSLVVCFDENDKRGLEELYNRGIENKVDGLKILSGEEVREIEPNLSKNIVAALYCPTGGIVSPFELCQAMGENAFENGVDFLFNFKVDSIKRIDDYYSINNDVVTKYVVNCAGLYADEIHNLVSIVNYKITPKKGDYIVLDRSVGNLVNSTIFQLPTEKGKGVLVTPTVYGNFLVGPSATDVDNKENTLTTNADLEYIIDKGKLSCDDIPLNKVITSFSGVRAHEASGDFIIKECEENFFDCIGIESPGLTSSPAIGKYVADYVASKLKADKNLYFNPKREGIKIMKNMSSEEKKEIIKENSLYGNIVCRCEEISEGEICEAIKRKPGATSLDGIKRRVHAGMGRCQGGFCSTKIIKILSRELGIPITKINKNNTNSYIIDSKMGDNNG